MNKRMLFTPAVKTLAGLVNEIKNVSRGGLDLQPKYQREFIWKNDFKDKLIYSIVRGYPIGSISIRVRGSENAKSAKSEVVDGQQRLTTIYNFVDKAYEVKAEYAKKIADDILDYLADLDGDKELEALKKKVSLGKRFKLTYKMLPEIVKGNVLNYQLSISNISDSTEDQTAEYFRFLQNQEILRAGEIINSLPETMFENFLLRLDDKEKFMRVIGYRDDRRRDFDKIFYSSIGVLDDELRFGATDADIKKYITSTSDNFSDMTLHRIECLIEQINEITKLRDETLERSNKRFIKLLFLLLGYGKFTFSVGDLSSALTKLSAIEGRLSAFFSAKRDALEKTFSIFEPAENRRDIIEDYRQLAVFTKGIQNLRIAGDRIDLLNKIIERELTADNDPA
jgi:hypothetical protein